MPRIRTISSELAAGAVLLAAVAGVGCRLPDALTEGMFSEATSRAHPAAADCERCHQEIYREWEGSLHARAFRHPAFQSASAGARAGGCVPCHAPTAFAEGVPPSARVQRRDEGVTCISCHLSPQRDAAPRTMRGPVSRSSPIEIHPIIEADPFYLSSELCGTCHVEALREWSAAPRPGDGSEPPTCQSCHMPAVRRKVESVHDEHPYSAFFVALGEETDLRRHTFDVPDADEDEIGLRAFVVDPGPNGELRVSVENRLPHDLPTGSFGGRALRVRVRGLDGEAAKIRNRRTDGALSSGETWVVRFPLEGDDPGGLEAVLERRDHRAGGWSVLRSARVGGEEH